jgi:hypothetical protein
VRGKSPTHRSTARSALGLRAVTAGVVMALQTTLSFRGALLMVSVKRLTGMLRRAWRDRAKPGHRSNRFASTRSFCLEALEDRLCPSGYLVVASYDNNRVLRYNESTGAFVDQIDPNNLANLKEPTGVLFGPDHNLYVSDRVFQGRTGQQAVLKYNGTTGAFQSVFASQNIGSPRGILFGPDGNLYVADGGITSTGNATIDRFDGKTGAFLDYFVPLTSGGLAHPAFMVFGPDGNLYVDEFAAGSILRYYGPNSANPGAPDPAPGQTGAVFVPPASGGLDAPQGITFGPDGNIYVASTNEFISSNGISPPGAVLKFEGSSGPNPGAFLGTFVASGYGGLANPSGVLFGPNGDLYVSSYVNDLGGTGKIFNAESGTSMVLRYAGPTGAFLGTFVATDSGGLHCPIFMTFTETDPTTLNYHGTTTSAAPAAQPANSTPTTSTAGPLIASSSTSPALLLASPPPGSSIDPAALSVALSRSQLPATPAATAPPALPTGVPLTAAVAATPAAGADGGDLVSALAAEGQRALRDEALWAALGYHRRNDIPDPLS